MPFSGCVIIQLSFPASRATARLAGNDTKSHCGVSFSSLELAWVLSVMEDSPPSVST
jgi:hypothetical protein